MALSGIHPPPAFLQTAGEPSVPWKDWLEAFDQYVIATGIVDSGEGKPRLRALLTHCLGLEGQRILGTARTVTSYDELRTLLTQEFGPRVNAMVERFHFRQRAQLPGESVRHYVFALRTLAATCKFGALTDEMIRDQLIEKTTLSQIRNRLLMEAERLTLGNALALAIRVEEAGRDSAGGGGGGEAAISRESPSWKEFCRMQVRSGGSSGVQVTETGEFFSYEFELSFPEVWKLWVYVSQGYNLPS